MAMAKLKSVGMGMDVGDDSGDKEAKVGDSKGQDPGDESLSQGQSKEKDAQTQVKEILQERIDLYKVGIDENELNLRRNIILGGVFYFDMLQIPPQPKRVGNWVNRLI